MSGSWQGKYRLPELLLKRAMLHSKPEEAKQCNEENVVGIPWRSDHAPFPITQKVNYPSENAISAQRSEESSD